MSRKHLIAVKQTFLQAMDGWMDGCRNDTTHSKSLNSAGESVFQAATRSTVAHVRFKIRRTTRCELCHSAWCASLHRKGRKRRRGTKRSGMYSFVPFRECMITLSSCSVAFLVLSPGLIDSLWQWLSVAEAFLLRCFTLMGHGVVLALFMTATCPSWTSKCSPFIHFALCLRHSCRQWCRPFEAGLCGEVVNK